MKLELYLELLQYDTRFMLFKTEVILSYQNRMNILEEEVISINAPKDIFDICKCITAIVKTINDDFFKDKAITGIIKTFPLKIDTTTGRGEVDRDKKPVYNVSFSPQNSHINRNEDSPELYAAIDSFFKAGAIKIEYNDLWLDSIKRQRALAKLWLNYKCKELVVSIDGEVIHRKEDIVVDATLCNSLAKVLWNEANMKLAPSLINSTIDSVFYIDEFEVCFEENNESYITNIDGMIASPNKAIFMNFLELTKRG